MNGVIQTISVLLVIQISCSYGQSTSANSKCLTPDNYVGKCISIRDCKDLLLLLEYRGKDPRVVQFLRKSQCGVAGNNPKVCCSTGVVNNPKPPPPKDDSDSKVCGIPDVSQKIIGGEGVALGDYPWMAALGYRRRKHAGPEWICGGTLISSRYVLTASHCLHGISPWELYMVRLGDVNLNNTVNDGATPLDIPIESTLIHEKYTSSPITNDVALVKLKYAVQYTDLIKPICLPAAQDFKSKSILDHQYAFVAGWGKTSFTITNSFSSHLQDLRVPIQPIDVCKQAYKTIPRSYVDDRNICAGYLQGQKDSCQGDSGGPLMWINSYDSKYYLIGIVSFGYKCAEPGYPGVYTKVAEYMDWIRLHAK